MKNIIITAFAMMFLAGCATTYNVNVAVFGGKSDLNNKTYEMRLSKKTKGDLEHMGYVEQLRKRLACEGWSEVSSGAAYIIEPEFGTTGIEVEDGPSTGFNIGLGFFGGSVGSGLGLGVGSANRVSTRPVPSLELKLFDKSANSDTPVWQGKFVNTNTGNKLNEVAPVLVKYAVENIGKSTDGDEEFSFSADEKELKALSECK
ncbi:MAG: hypothetical protein AB7E76_14100 [Deferribacterales bacterium]